MASRERRIEGSFSFHSKMSASTACCDGSITEERNGDSRGWLARTVGKGKHVTPGDGSTECLACGKRGHNVDTCFRIHKCQICGKRGHLASTCYQNLEYKSQHVFSQNRSLSSIGSSLECQICSKKGHTAAKCFYRADVPANHPSLFIPTCQICGLKGHTAAKCFYRANVSADHPSLFIPTCQICGLKCHVALNCTRRTTFAYQVSESPTSLTALTALSAGSYNGNHTQSQGGYACFPGGFHPNNGASTTSVNSEVWVSDSQRIPIPGASVHLNQLPTELMRDHNSDVVVSTCSNDSAGTGGNGNDDNNVGSHNGEGHNDYDSGSNSAGSENASNHGCNSDFVDSSHVVTCEEDNIHVLNSTIQDAYVGSIDLHDSKVGEQADDNNADINGGQNSLAFNNDKTFQKALNSSFAFFIILISRSPEFSSLFVDDKLQKGLRGVSEEDVEVVLDKQHLAKQLLSGKTVSDDAERSMILKLKTVCGYQFISKLTGAALSSDMTGDVTADSSMEGFSSNDLTVLQFGGNINGVSKTECYEIDGLSSGDCELVNADTNLVDSDGLIVNDSSRSDDTMQGSAAIDGESGDSTSADLSNDIMTGNAYTMKKLKKLEMLQRGQVEHVKAERNLYTWERAHMGIFTELGVLYARYSLEKLMDNSKLVSAFDVITEEVKDMAEAIAEEWKPKLNIFDMAASYGNSLEAKLVDYSSTDPGDYGEPLNYSYVAQNEFQRYPCKQIGHVCGDDCYDCCDFDGEEKVDEKMDINDVTIEYVLPSLPAKALCKFRSVGKQWDQAHSFLNISGPFCQLPDEVPSFVSLNRDASGIPSVSLGFLPEPVVVRTAYNGMLCCESCNGENTNYICNPVIKEWTVLPKSMSYHGYELVLSLASELVCAFSEFSLPPTRRPQSVIVERYDELCYILPVVEDFVYTLEIYGDMGMKLKHIISLAHAIFTDAYEELRTLACLNNVMIMLLGMKLIAYHVKAEKADIIYMYSCTAAGYAGYLPYVNSLVHIDHP